MSANGLMDLTKNDDNPLMVAQSMCRTFGLPEKFLNQLRHADDDWSFVIKCHALMESGLSFLLVSVLGRPPLRRTLSRLETSRKILMCFDLALCDQADRGRMQLLSKLRNDLVHNVANVTFSFDEHLKDRGQADQFVEIFGTIWKDPLPPIGGATVGRKQFTLENARFTIWMWIVYLLAEMELYHRESELQRHRTEENQKLVAQYHKLFRDLATVSAWTAPPVPMSELAIGSPMTPVPSEADPAEQTRNS